MGCDGTWEKYSNQEVANLISEKVEANMPLEQILTWFLDNNLADDTSCKFHNLGGQGCDNMTSMLIIFKWA